MHLRPRICPSVADTVGISNWNVVILHFLCECMSSQLWKKKRIHCVQVRPSILFQKLSNMKNVVFWSVTPCSLIDDRTWFRENLSLRWAALSTGKSKLYLCRFRSEQEISQHTVWLPVDPLNCFTFCTGTCCILRRLVCIVVSCVYCC